ncbi:MAG: outer membrane protein assembly factor [Bacteroidales bacterium]|nr:outer membrane protein assembly factor [Bacteroidales bacterium]
MPRDEYLLRSFDINIDNKNVSKEKLTPFVRQKPNKKILGMRFHLWLYNQSKLDKDNKWNNWLRKNGEEPVVWQQTLTERSREQLGLSLRNQGYYYAKVTDTVILKKQKATVLYSITTGWPYVVSRMSYTIPDTTVARLVFGDTIHSLIRPGMLFDAGIMQKERKRIETNLKENGYYSFSEEFITFNADTAHRNRTVSLNMNIRAHTEQTEDNQLIETPYPLYTIRSLTVNASLDMQNLREDRHRKSATDTIVRGSVQFIMPRLFPVKASTIAQSLHILPGSLFRISRVNRTYQHLLSLHNFRQANIEFTEPPGQNASLMRELDCRINLLPFMRQSYTVDLEGTNSDGNLGGGVRLLYQNKSLFGHAEIFDLRLRGMVEAVSATEAALQFKTAMEYEAEATLNIPKFMLPIQPNSFIRRYNPKTAFSILYNYQRRPQYTRSVFSTSVGYNWRGSSIISHTIRPIDIKYVQLDNVNATYGMYLEKYPYLKNSYQTHMVVSGNYTFSRDLQQLKKDNFFFIRTNLETAGFLLNIFSRLTDRSADPAQPYKILDNTYSQFVRGDVDIRNYSTINANNRLVTRLFVGVGWPYGNSTTRSEDGKILASMPFEKKYYSGGAMSMRGWRLRSLGPGSFRDSVSISAYPNNTGDIKLEANLEYRFKLVWVMEGALFLDAGNVWDSHKDEKRAGADFDFKRFYREIALDAGIGFRFDFTYFILSIDGGMKLFDPAGYRGWVFKRTPGWERPRIFNLSFGIGYPF